MPFTIFAENPRYRGLYRQLAEYAMSNHTRAYKVAERLRQKDRMKSLGYGARRAQEVILDYFESPTPEKVPLFIANFGTIIPKEFIGIGDDEFRALVRMEPEQLWDMMYERIKSKL